MEDGRRNPWVIYLSGISLSFNLGLSLTPALGQVIPDRTLQLESSVVQSDGQGELITGGAARGASLFHSFEQLNVAEGRSLLFANPPNISQIFSRVTGNSPSNIQGVLGVLGNADLFLLNPNGILFGPKARLDLSGSFLASTGEDFLFEGFEFGAIAPQPVSLLTITAPVGINLGSNPGPIVNRSTADGLGLAVQPFQSLRLVGGDITLVGGAMTALDGKLELLSVGQISLSDGARVVVQDLVGNPESELRMSGQAITLDGGSLLASVNRSAARGADIQLQAQNLALMEGSNVVAQTWLEGRGGDVVATVSDQIKLTSATIDTKTIDTKVGSASRLIAETWGPGRAGDVVLNTSRLLTEYDSAVFNQSNVFSTGDSGNITIHASESVVGRYASPLTGVGGGIFATTRGAGTGGTIQLTTPLLKNNVSSNAWWTGNGGDVIINSKNTILDQVSPLIPEFSSSINAATYGSGRGGNVKLTTDNLILQNGSKVITTSFANRDDLIVRLGSTYPQLLELVGLPGAGLGQGGDVTVKADNIVVDGFNPAAPASSSQISSISLGKGNAGNVDITTKNLALTQGGLVVSSSLFAFSTLGLPLTESGQGDGGNVMVQADDIMVSGLNPLSGLSSLLGNQTAGFGDAGNTSIQTRQLRILDGGTVVSGTFTSGNGGRLSIQATESILIDGVHASGQPSTLGTYAAAPSPLLQRAFFLPATPRGNTGQLQIKSDRLTLHNGGQISVAHEGTGNAGALMITANTLDLSNRGQITAATLTGQGGNVGLDIQDILLLRRGSRITASAMQGEGGGGNIAIATANLRAIPQENSDIIAKAVGGSGGNIDIEAGFIIAPPNEDADISANAFGGSGGQVTIRTNSILGTEVRDRPTTQSDITASSDTGINGTVTIDQLAVSPALQQSQLPSDPQTRALISNVCDRPAASRFVVTGRGGLSNDPRQQLTLPTLLEDDRSGTLSSLPPTQPPSPMAMTPVPTEAQGLRRDRQGHIHLVASSSWPTPPRAQVTCQPQPEMQG